MPVLYLPSASRRTSAAQRLLDSIVQDTVRTDPGSRQWTVANAAVAELERIWATVLRLDPRPWRADTRTPGSVVQAEEHRPDQPTEELFYGVPSAWTPVLRKAWAYDAPPGTGLIDDQGQLRTPLTVDRAVLAQDRVILQTGRDLYAVSADYPAGQLLIPEEEGIYGRAYERFTLGSRPTTYVLYPGSAAAEEVPVRPVLDGLFARFGGPGRFRLTAQHLAVASVSHGTLLSELPALHELGYLYHGTTRERLAYTAVDGALVIDSAGTHQLFYTARQEKTYNAPPLPLGTAVWEQEDAYAVSLASEAELMYRLPDQIEAVQLLDIIARVPGIGGAVPIDAEGYVGRVGVGHAIEHLLVSDYHIVVADAHTVTVVEYDAEQIVLQQRFPALEIRGLSWSSEGEFGLVCARSDGFDFYVLQDQRTARSGAWEVYA